MFTVGGVFTASFGYRNLGRTCLERVVEPTTAHCSVNRQEVLANANIEN